MDVVWCKSGKLIQKSLKYEMIRENEVVKLIVHSVTAKDAGEYSCEVTGGPTSKAQLEIKGVSSVIFHNTFRFADSRKRKKLDQNQSYCYHPEVR